MENNLMQNDEIKKMKAIKKLWKKNESTQVNLTNLPLTT
jgi:hypothetical protein